jgi:hypothetical protein
LILSIGILYCAVTKLSRLKAGFYYAGRSHLF